ncbi:MAG: DUF5615 family PIN-like protein [Bacteroidota bacterium]
MLKLIIDAQLPMALKNWLLERGHDVIHTRDLPEGNLTPDREVIVVAEAEERIVTSKDSDFHKHYILHGSPKRILMITTGNIVNKVLLELFESNFHLVEEAFHNGSSIVEFSNETVVVHE